MKFDKTIEILDLNIKEAGKHMPADTLEALKQSRECTRFCNLVYRYPHLIDKLPLPEHHPSRPADTTLDLYAPYEDNHKGEE